MVLDSGAARPVFPDGVVEPLPLEVLRDVGDLVANLLSLARKNAGVARILPDVLSRGLAKKLTRDAGGPPGGWNERKRPVRFLAGDRATLAPVRANAGRTRFTLLFEGIVREFTALLPATLDLPPVGLVLAPPAWMRAVKPEFAVVPAHGVFFLVEDAVGASLPLIWLNARPFHASGRRLAWTHPRFWGSLSGTIFHELVHFLDLHLAPPARQPLVDLQEAILATPAIWRKEPLRDSREVLPVVLQLAFEGYLRERTTPETPKSFRGYLAACLRHVERGPRQDSPSREPSRAFPRSVFARVVDHLCDAGRAAPLAAVLRVVTGLREVGGDRFLAQAS